MKIPNTKQTMSTNLPLPDRELFEREVHDLFHNGDISAIARYLHKDQAAVSKALNPFDDSRVHPIYEFLRYLWAMDCQRENLGDAVLTIITREREKWLPDCEIYDSAARLTGNCLRETSEAVECEISQADIDTQIREFVDARDAYDEKIRSLISQRSESFGVRRWAKEAVNGRR